MNRSGCRQRGRRGGFTLLEVMLALGILGLALVVLIEIVTNNVRATNHARMVTTATFLARTKMAALEDKVLEEGFGDLDLEDTGDFSDDRFPNFQFYSIIERIELPANATEQASQAATEQVSSASSPLEAMSGMLGGFMSTLIEPIRVGLEESVRRVTVRVSWNEPGRPDQGVDVVTFLTDPSKLDMAMQAVGGQGQQGQPGQGPQGQPGQGPQGQPGQGPSQGQPGAGRQGQGPRGSGSPQGSGLGGGRR